MLSNIIFFSRTVKQLPAELRAVCGSTQNIDVLIIPSLQNELTHKTLIDLYTQFNVELTLTLNIIKNKKELKIDYEKFKTEVKFNKSLSKNKRNKLLKLYNIAENAIQESNGEFSLEKLSNECRKFLKPFLTDSQIELDGKNILIIEDLYDSEVTENCITEVFNNYKPKNVVVYLLSGFEKHESY